MDVSDPVLPFPDSAEIADNFEPRLKPASRESDKRTDPVVTSLSAGPTMLRLAVNSRLSVATPKAEQPPWLVALPQGHRPAFPGRQVSCSGSSRLPAFGKSQSIARVLCPWKRYLG